MIHFLLSVTSASFYHSCCLYNSELIIPLTMASCPVSQIHILMWSLNGWVLMLLGIQALHSSIILLIQAQKLLGLICSSNNLLAYPNDFEQTIF